MLDTMYGARGIGMMNWESLGRKLFGSEEIVCDQFFFFIVRCACLGGGQNDEGLFKDHLDRAEATNAVIWQLGQAMSFFKPPAALASAICIHCLSVCAYSTLTHPLWPHAALFFHQQNSRQCTASKQRNAMQQTAPP